MQMCQQPGCSNQALFRYTWPGYNESFICMPHAKRLDSIADVAGLRVQLILLPDPRFVEIAEEQMKAIEVQA